MKGTAVDRNICGSAARSGLAAFANGQTGFNANAAEECLNSVEAWQCADTVTALVRIDQFCGLAYAGTASEGGTCTLDSDCMPPRGGYVLCTNGACAATPLYGRAGDSCAGRLSVECASYLSLTCLTPSNATTGTCQPQLGPGEACSLSRHCADGLWCGPTGVCEAHLKAGEACPFGGCTWGTLCTGGTCSPVGLEGTYFCQAS